jgi:ATP-binding cassette, subfamily B, multidrug efflux pump
MKSFYLIKPYLVANLRTLFFGIGCLITVDFLQLLIPRIIKRAVDDLTGYGIDTAGLLTYAGEIIGLALLIGVFRYIWRRCLIGTSRVVEEGLRNRLFSHVQTLSAAYFDRTRSGDIMAHATNDIQHVRMATGMGMVALTDGIVLGTAAVGFMAYINLRLTLFVLIPMPFIVFGTRFFSRKMHRIYGLVQARFGDMTEAVRERFAGVRIIKAFTGEAEALAGFRKISTGYIAGNLKLVRITGFFFPMMLFFSNLSLVIILFLGGRDTLTFTITPGDFVAFISYIGLITWPMMAMGWVTNLIQRGKASLDRIDLIMSTRPDVVDRPEPISMPAARGDIRFENVSFAYETGARNTLERIMLDLAPGQTAGIVGPPGSGKTSLLNLVPRLYDVTGGQILIDGNDIRDIRLADLRSRIGLVPQEPFLFSGTIRENLEAGRSVSETDLARAIDEAALTDTLAAFPDGLETVVGEKGVIMSGGQKQRIALARALIRRPPILLFDDPISQVDAQTGAAIIDSIRALSGKRTILIVSHRISAVRFSDQIVVMAAGRIAASGTHATLIDHDNFYSRTYRLQQIEDEFNHRETAAPAGEQG